MPIPTVLRSCSSVPNAKINTKIDKKKIKYLKKDQQYYYKIILILFLKINKFFL